jgi:hypothetical protein
MRGFLTTTPSKYSFWNNIIEGKIIQVIDPESTHRNQPVLGSGKFCSLDIKQLEYLFNLLLKLQ